MITLSRTVAPTMLLAAGTIAGAAHGAVITQNYNLAAGLTAQNVAIGGTDLYSFGADANGQNTAGKPYYDARFSSLGNAELSTCSSSSSLLNPNDQVNVFPIGSFPQYGKGGSATPSDVGTSYFNLRFQLNGETLYGNARFDGSTTTLADGSTLENTQLTQIRYGTLADALAETPAAVPEPATWAEMIVGLGAAGGAMRAARRRKAQARATA